MAGCEGGGIRMTGKFAAASDIAKLGLISQQNCALGTFPAIDNTHSIMFEFYLHWDAQYTPATYGPLFTFRDAAVNNLFNSWVYNTVTYPGEISMSLWKTGWDETTRIPQPQIGNRGRDKYWVFLLDRTNNKKQIYEDGSIAKDDALGIQNPDFSAINNVFTVLGAPQAFCGEILLVRLTVLPSIPADMANLIAYMHRAPTVLHPTLQALTPSIASQYDFSNITVDSGLHSNRTIHDHGTVVTTALNASIDLEQEISVGERCTLSRPDKIYYHLGESHYAGNGSILGHGIAGGAHILEIIMDLQWNYIRHGSDSHFVFLVDAGVGPIFLRQVAGKDYYELGLGKWAGYYIYKNLFPFNVLHIAMDGTNYAYVDGQQIVYDTGAGPPPDYTGTWPGFYLGGDPWYTFRHHVPGFRFWNYPAGTLPTNWESEVQRRAHSPWQSSSIFGTPPLEWLMNDDIAGGSLIIPCTGSAGAVGDLTIVPGAPFANVRQEWKT